MIKQNSMKIQLKQLYVIATSINDEIHDASTGAEERVALVEAYEAMQRAIVALGQTPFDHARTRISYATSRFSQ